MVFLQSRTNRFADISMQIGFIFFCDLARRNDRRFVPIDSDYGLKSVR